MSIDPDRRRPEEKADSAGTIRQFLPAMPSGLVQTEDYARAALTRMVETDPARDVEKAVRARLARQTSLVDPNRGFIFLLTEQAVRWRYASSEIMAAQCLHMSAVAERQNVELAVIPQSTEVAGGALNTFVVYDERLVLAELFSGEAVLRSAT